MTDLEVGLCAVIVAITDDQPRVLTVPGGGLDALPTGPLDPAGDLTLERALRRWVRSAAGVELGYVEQLYTFGDRFRDPREAQGGARVVLVAYLALVHEGVPAPDAAGRWRPVYGYLPWEDWREGRPAVVDRHLAPALERWVAAAADGSEREARQERAAVSFGLGGAPWDGERVLDRYELLWEMGLVGEAGREEGGRGAGAATALGLRMVHDHRRILATALGRLRGKIRYRPVVFELLPADFTLLELQRAVESLAGVRLHKQNFRRLVEQGGLVESTGAVRGGTGGRPARLFRFRREVLQERPAPGVGLPGARR